MMSLFPCFASAQSEVDSLLNVASKTDDTIRKIDALNQAAYALRNSNADSVIILAEQSEKLAKSVGYTIGLADAKMNRGIVLTAKGNYYSALQLFLDARLVFEDYNERERFASVINNIGRIYNFMDDYDQALEYYKQSVKIFTDLNIPEREAAILNNIGYIYKLLGNHEKSLEYLNAALGKIIDLDDESAVLYPFYNKGSVFVKSGQRDSAAFYLNRSLSYAKKIRDHYIISLTLIDFGQLYLDQRLYNKAQANFKEAYDVSHEAGLKNEARDAARLLSDVYEIQGEYQLALTYHRLYKEVDDAIFDKNLAKKIAFQEAEYNFKKLQVQEEVERKKLELEREKDLNNAIWARNTLVAGILVLALITYLLYSSFKRKRSANQALRKLNAKIESQTEELQRANHEIIVMNNNLERTVNERTKQLKRRNEQLKDYLSSNSHIVRAPLARILGLVDLYEPDESENLDFINKNLHASAKELDDALREINKMLSSDESAN